jgi:hypothetical protein
VRSTSDKSRPQGFAVGFLPSFAQHFATRADEAHQAYDLIDAFTFASQRFFELRSSTENKIAFRGESSPEGNYCYIKGQSTGRRC